MVDFVSGGPAEIITTTAADCADGNARGQGGGGGAAVDGEDGAKSNG